MIRTTQVSSLKQLKNLDGKRKTVYDIIKSKGKATNRMIAKALNWDINRVTGRVTELVGLGLVSSKFMGQAKLCWIRDSWDRFW